MTFASSACAAFFSACFPASFLLLVLLCAPQRVLARPPQSADAPPAQQPAAGPAKKDPSPVTPVAAAAAKANAPKPHRVFTNDDLSPNSGIPIAPGARRRLKQLNRCDRTCFVEVEKQALGYGYSSDYPRTRKEMEDRLAGYIEELQNDPKWQRLLLEMISAHIDSCLLRQKGPPPDDTPPHTPTRPELLDEEERMRNYRPAPSSNYNAADSAVNSYIYRMSPNRFKNALMVHQYMDEGHRDCSVVLPAAASEDASEDP